jgi:predicted RNA binding protein YcfA (HicA-like mRNA interferase family)
MRTLTGKQLSRLLRKKGWTLARTTGSHHIFVRHGSDLRITVPVHANRDLKSGLQRAIMKQADISEDEL